MLKQSFFAVILLILITPVLADIKINEIMSNPDPCSDSYCEYIEIYNNNESSVNVSSWKFTDDVGEDYFDLSYFSNDDIIIPGLYYALIVDTDTRIYHNYDINESVVWIYVDDVLGSSGLKNTGETITIYDANNNTVDTITYEEVDAGNTYSLVNSTWQETPPTPGNNNLNNETYTNDYSVISISEFLPNPEGEDNANMPDGEWIELYNQGTLALDLLGFEFYDNYGSDPDVIISQTSVLSTTIIQPDSYLVIYTNGISSFLNNNNFEKITLKDIYGNDIDEVTYHDSDEAVSWSLSEEKWQKTTPTPGYFNLDNSSSTKSEIKIEEIYDLGSDKKAEWGDIVRIKLFASKGNTNKNVIWIWIENDIERITKKSKFNIYDKFSNYTLTYPLAIPDNCDKEFLDGNYKIIASGLDASEEATLEIRDRPLCKDYKESTRVKNLEYSINSIPSIITVQQPFTTEVSLKNNQKEDINLDVWSYPYSGKKKYVKTDEKENLQSITIKPSEEKTVKLSNTIEETDKDSLNFKIKLQRADRKTPYELKDKLTIFENTKNIETQESKNFKTPITGFTIYKSSGEKAKRSAIFFFNGILALLFLLLIKNAINS